MRFSKQVVLLLSALLLCAGGFLSAPAAAKTPPMKSALWQELDKRDHDSGYGNVLELLDKLVFSNQFPDKDDKDIIRIWLRVHLQENPLYGLLYARLHLDEALVQSDYNTPAHREAVATAVMSFYTNALLLKSDISSCADDTAGQELKTALEKDERKYRRHFNDLDPMLQPPIIRAIERSRDNNKDRKPNTEFCKSGETSTESDQYSIEQGENGSKIVHQGAAPATVSDEEWQQRRDALYRDTLESLQ